MHHFIHLIVNILSRIKPVVFLPLHKYFKGDIPKRTVDVSREAAQYGLRLLSIL